MESSDKILSGRTCLVTGAARGLGKSVAERFLDDGARVVVTDIDEELLKSVFAEYSKRGQTLPVQCDVTDARKVKALVEQSVKHFGQLDVLVNCAGVVDRFEPLGDVSQDLFEKVLAVNLTGTFLLSKEVLNHCLSRGATDASIVNIGSVASECGWGAGAAYTSSKHAVMGLTKSTAAFYRTKGIRCNLVMPGGMNTDIIATATAQGRHTEGYQLLEKMMDTLQTPISDTKEIAHLCAFLASTRSSALNGALIKADKGQTTVL